MSDPLQVPKVVFSEWERITGKHPVEHVRRLGIAIQRAYMRAIGREDVHDRVISMDSSADYDTDLDRRERWDRAAADVLAWQANPTTGDLALAIHNAYCRMYGGGQFALDEWRSTDPVWQRRYEQMAAEVAAWQQDQPVS